MAPGLTTWRSSQRRKNRTNSDSSRRLHARWGDASITAPNDGGWSRPDDEANLARDLVLPGSASPDSDASTLVNSSPELGYGSKQPELVETVLPRQKEKARSTITITIPLPWSKRTHGRSASLPQPETTDAQHGTLPSTTHPAVANILQDSQLGINSAPNTSFPVTLHGRFTGSPVDQRIPPPLHTKIPIAQSQPASALSVLSPVREDFNRDGSQTTSPATATTVVDPSLVQGTRDFEHRRISVSANADRRRTSSRTRSASRGPAANRNSMSRPGTSSSMRRTSFDHETITSPATTGPDLRQTSFMRSSSRDSGPRTPLPSTPAPWRQGSSREPGSRRAMSTEPIHRRAVAREPPSKRASSLQTRNTRRDSGSVSDSDSSDDSLDDFAMRNSGADDSYFQRRRMWYGEAGAGDGGFYKNVAQDYKGIAKDVEAELALKRHCTLERDLESKLHIAEQPELVSPQVLVPTQEELWG